MRFKVDIAGSIKRDLMAFDASIAAASKAAAKTASDGLKKELRGQIVRAGMGTRLANTWRSAVYPAHTDSKNAAGAVWSKAPHIIRSFDRGTIIRAGAGKWLAIRTENVPKSFHNDKPITPMNFPEHRFGKLRFVYRPDGSGLLVVDGVGFSKKTGRATSARKGGAYTKTGRLKKGAGTAIMFILVPQVRMKKKLDVEGAFQKWGARFTREFDQELLRRADKRSANSKRS